MRDGVRAESPDHDQREHACDEHHGGERQQARRLGDPEHVHGRQEREADERDEQQVVGEPGEHAAEARRARGKTHGDGEDVVDDHRCGREQTPAAPKASLGDRVRSASLGVRGDHLRVGGDDRGERAAAGDDEHQHDRFGPVRDARERVEAQCGEAAEQPELVGVRGVLPDRAPDPRRTCQIDAVP